MTAEGWDADEPKSTLDPSTVKWRKKRKMLAIAAFLSCFTAQDVKIGKCDVACRRSGYDYGSFRKDKCQCVDEMDYEEFVNRKALLLPKRKAATPTRPDSYGPTLDPWNY